MYRKVVCLVAVAVLLGLADVGYGHARWRNLLGDQDFSNPENWIDQPGLLTGRMIINRGIVHPDGNTAPPIMSYTPDPCYSPISLYTGHDQDDSHVEWYITGGSMHVTGQWDMCRNSGTSSYTEMTGGYLRFDGDISCPMVAGTSATLILHGGDVRASGIQFQSGGLIDLAGSGRIILDGNDVADVDEWKTAGYLTADGGLGELFVSYTMDANVTIITASNIRAWDPQPQNDEKNLCPGVVLTWRPGADAAVTQGHDVYFGTDYDDVADADTSTAVIYIGRQDGNSYSPSLVMDQTYYWRVDETDGVEIWTGSVWEFTTNDGTAFDPNAADGAVGVPLDVVLNWSPGCLADTHDIYFGTDFNDVNEATTSTAEIFKGNQPGTSYGPDGDLDYYTTYYWRIDEVGSGGSPLWTGDVWSFRSESAIFDPNLRLWYKFDGTEEQGSWVYDSSGREYHSYDGTVDERWEPNDGRFGGSLWCDEDIGLAVSPDMLKFSNGITISVWLKDAYKAGGDNIVFGAGDGDYEIRGDVVEESAQEVMFRAGNDSNDVIRWSPDENPATLEGWHHWGFVKNEATGRISIYYDGRLAISTDTGEATLFNLDSTPFKVGSSGHSNTDLVGHIDDFRVYDFAMSADQVAALFRGGELELAWSPEPGDNAKDVPREVTLIWRPGQYADQHDVYLGTDFDDVNDADTTSDVYVDRRGPNEYDPPGDLAMNTTYYWRIDEVNTTDPNIWKGAVWRFTVANFIIIDSFESYTCDNDMYANWLDGWNNHTGSTLLLSAPGDPTHTGDKSQLYSYNNVGSPYYSEAERVLGAGEQDFTEAGVKVLTMYFYGKSTNTATTKEQLYAGLYDGGTYAEVRYGTQVGESITDIQLEEWSEWNVALSDFTDVTLNSVDGLFIGFGSRSASSAGGNGLVFFDDIRLYPPKCVPSDGPEYDFSGNCIVDIADVGVMGEEWLKTDVNFSDLGITVTEPSSDNLVGFWKLEGNGNDSSGKGNNGTPEGTYSWVTGYDDVNQAIEFDEGRVLVPDHATLRPESVVSAACWVYYDDDPGSSARVVVKGPDNFEAYCLELGGAYEFTFYVGEPNGQRYFADANEGDVRPGEWMHLGGTYDGTTVKSYVNGLVVGTEANSISLSQDTNDLAIGNRSDANDRPFTGIVDEVRVYNVALSQAEMAWLATDGTGYVPLRSTVNIYDEEPQGSRAINFRDVAKLMTKWLEKKLWPPEP